jgi:hypothetical protein
LRCFYQLSHVETPFAVSADDNYNFSTAGFDWCTFFRPSCPTVEPGAFPILVQLLWQDLFAVITPALGQPR